ncbi:hypothetical protein AK88_05610 [Plasmodium fragile]|uniref:Uncharacterized protein n=1 Tax=Plasmodium fragile TaxID=5857 RepID=A0A0D9QD58_PLAFR|nr:uncharacterized protein AK88_05610 [Plasmodium fragile]KJP84757.1 hypothetical protein AK88_05610 [Plasmodium fragile]
MVCRNTHNVLQRYGEEDSFKHLSDKHKVAGVQIGIATNVRTTKIITDTQEVLEKWSKKKKQIGNKTSAEREAYKKSICMNVPVRKKKLFIAKIMDAYLGFGGRRITSSTLSIDLYLIRRLLQLERISNISYINVRNCNNL